MLGAAALAALVFFRRRTLSRGVMLGLLVAGLVPTGALAYTANLGGQIRHPEIRSGEMAPGGERAAAAGEARKQDDD